jgi:hypothetical protein
VRVEQELRQLVRGGAHLVRRELRDLHEEKYLDAEQGYECPDEVVVDPRLADVVLRACGADLEHALLVVVAADRDHRELRLLGAQPSGRLDAVDLRHLDVDHNGVDGQLARELEGLAPVAGIAHHRKALVGLQHLGEGGEEALVVFGDEDPVQA